MIKSLIILLIAGFSLGEICPDYYECLGSTCCLLLSGVYGCCPYQNAVCCPDKIHCCSENEKCNVKAQKCDSHMETLPFFWLNKVGFGGDEMFKTVRSQMFEDRRASFVEANKVEGSLVQSHEIKKNKDKISISDVIRCPDGRICKIGDSCCRKETGGFGCCPYLNATCCSDMIHCCPKGYQCDVVDSMCILVEFEEESVPQSHFEGKGNRPKTLVASEIANAENTQKLSVVIQRVQYNSHLCLNDPSYPTCHDNTTCCWSQASLGSKCCPFPSGVCCDDGLNCCPNGFQCDTGNNRCLKSALNPHTERPSFVSVPLTPFSSDPVTSVETVVKRERLENHEIECTNGQDKCPDDTTCCMNNSKRYGCCTYPDAVCCSDRIHCCPNDYSCDLVNQKCVPNYGTIFYLAVPFITFEEIVSIQSTEDKEHSDIICPNGSDDCHEGETCCLTDDKKYGCCPLAGAVCCSDGHYCCPNGYTCDLANADCIMNTGNLMRLTIPFIALDKTSQKQKDKESSDIVCPNGKDNCHEGETCCLSADKKYGCCPFAGAVCCSDGQHCCPNGYTCDLANAECIMNTGNLMRLTIPYIALEKTSQKQKDKESSDIVCPNGKDNCHEGETCCLSADKKYGCCPFAGAVCCSDGQHCCPNGYTCDLANAECIMNTGNLMRLTIPFIALEKTSQKQKDKESSDIVCPNGKDNCHEGETCCLSADKKYGCCPFAGAVCCSDGQHCCPNGYTCDLANMECLSNIEGGEIRVVKPTSVQKEYSVLKTSYNLMACPDGTNCADKSTCCKTKSGNYGCCPYANGSCCPDGIHCCPSGSKLPLDVGRTHTDETEDPMIMCPDKIDYCKEDETCCEMSGGRYGCCPTKEGVCCDDKETCCPHGTRCDNGGCARGSRSNVITDFLAMNIEGGEIRVVKPTSVQKEYSVLKTSYNLMACPDGTNCADKSTCCKTKSGNYGCCPYANGSCCPDGIHCCPSGSKCDDVNKRCIHSFLSNFFSEKESASLMYNTIVEKFEVPLDVGRTHTDETEDPMIMCPDKIDYCKEDETCCEMSGGRYGCCPTKEGVCCDDKETCCPHGTRCDNGGCARGSRSNVITDFLAMVRMPYH